MITDIKLKVKKGRKRYTFHIQRDDFTVKWEDGKITLDLMGPDGLYNGSITKVLADVNDVDLIEIDYERDRLS